MDGWGRAAFRRQGRDMYTEGRELRLSQKRGAGGMEYKDAMVTKECNGSCASNGLRGVAGGDMYTEGRELRLSQTRGGRRDGRQGRDGYEEVQRALCA